MSTDPAPASGSSSDRGPASHPASPSAPRAAGQPASSEGAVRSGPASATNGRVPRRPDPRRRALANAIALGAAGLSVLLFLLLRPTTPPPQRATPPSTPATLSPSAQATAPIPVARSADVAAPSSGPEAFPDAFPGIEQLNSPTVTIRDDLILLSNVFSSWQTLFPQDGNPWGDNRDITAALSGQNSRRVALIPPSHPAISKDGELLDRWGTPLLFHQLSGTAMEVRSAGPDRVLYTADDTVLTP